MDNVLLHACCGPCSTVPLQLLSDGGVRVVALYDNPNIQPAEEYERRRATFCSLAEKFGVESVCASYDPEDWDAAIGERAGVYPLIEGDVAHATNRALREARCRACYAYRFGRLAEHARKSGFSAMATTLSISPYQFIDSMAEEFAAAAKRAGVASAFTDYRAQYPESVRRSRELGLYRQNYCGCRWSQAEAERERAASRELRKRQRRTNQNHV